MKLVALEGGDGAGKRTLAETLQKRLADLGRSCFLVSFPAYTETIGGKLIGEILDGSRDRPANQELMALLFSADRLEYFSRAGDKIMQSDFVIADRYIASNAAYHSAITTEGFDWECVTWVQQLELNVLQLPRPTLNVLLSTDTETSRRRQALKISRDYTSTKEDIFERDSRLQETVRATYARLAQTDLFGPWLTLQSRVQGSDVPASKLAQDVLDRVDQL